MVKRNHSRFAVFRTVSGALTALTALVAFAQPASDVSRERSDRLRPAASPQGEHRVFDPVSSSGDAESLSREGRREHLSPEERRRLRRDIDDAGRDLYRHGRPERFQRF